MRRNLYRKLKRRYKSLLSNKAKNTPSWSRFIDWATKWENNGKICEYCKRVINLHDNNPPYSKQVSLDHRLPLCHGGDNRLDNLALVCNRCNLVKTTMTEETYRELLFYIEKDEKLLEKILNESYKGRVAYKLDRLEKANELAPVDLSKDIEEFYLPPHTVLFCPDCRQPLSGNIGTGKLICLNCSILDKEDKIFNIVKEDPNGSSV